MARHMMTALYPDEDCEAQLKLIKCQEVDLWAGMHRPSCSGSSFVKKIKDLKA